MAKKIEVSLFGNPSLEPGGSKTVEVNPLLRLPIITKGRARTNGRITVNGDGVLEFSSDKARTSGPYIARGSSDYVEERDRPDPDDNTVRTRRIQILVGGALGLRPTTSTDRFKHDGKLYSGIDVCAVDTDVSSE